MRWLIVQKTQKKTFSVSLSTSFALVTRPVNELGGGSKSSHLIEKFGLYSKKMLRLSRDWLIFLPFPLRIRQCTPACRTRAAHATAGTEKGQKFLNLGTSSDFLHVQSAFRSPTASARDWCSSQCPTASASTACTASAASLVASAALALASPTGKFSSFTQFNLM